MTAFDYAVLAIVGLSIVVSVWRGAVRELFALASWVIAFFVAQAYGPPLAVYLPAALEHSSLRLLTAFVTVFVAVLISMMLVTVSLSKLIRFVGLGPADRVLGAVFGLLRGMLVILILVLLGGLTTLPRQRVWRDAMLSAPLEAAAVAIRAYLPHELSQRISYE